MPFIPGSRCSRREHAQVCLVETPSPSEKGGSSFYGPFPSSAPSARTSFGSSLQHERNEEAGRRRGMGSESMQRPKNWTWVCIRVAPHYHRMLSPPWDVSLGSASNHSYLEPKWMVSSTRLGIHHYRSFFFGQGNGHTYCMYAWLGWARNRGRCNKGFEPLKESCCPRSSEKMLPLSTGLYYCCRCLKRVQAQAYIDWFRSRKSQMWTL